MKRTRWNFGIIALAAMVALVVGCASSTMVPVKSWDASAGSYRSVRVSVQSRVAEDVTDPIRALEERIVTRIRETKRFDEITLSQDSTAAEGLLVRASVVNIRKVGGAGRFFLGALAGKASLTTDVEFRDGMTGVTMARYTLTEKTGSSGFSGTTGSCVDKIAKAIAKLAAERASAQAASAS